MSDPESSENTPPPLPGLRRLDDEEGLRVVRQMKLRLRPRFRPAPADPSAADRVDAPTEDGLSGPDADLSIPGDDPERPAR